MNESEQISNLKLWKDYYSVKKPFCPTCLAEGIKEEEYNFCSMEKQPIKVCATDYFGNPILHKVLHVFNEVYKCNVYDWTIYQEQGKLNQKIN